MSSKILQIMATREREIEKDSENLRLEGKNEGKIRREVEYVEGWKENEIMQVEAAGNKCIWLYAT